VIQAVVLCGGLGTRLRPLTYAVPKPLLPVGGRPILERIAHLLAGAGYREIALVTGFRSDLIERQLGPSTGDANLYYRPEPHPLGTAGALNMVRGETADPFLVMNGDLLTDIDLGAMAELHRSEGAAITLATRALPVPVPYGVVETRDRLVTGIREKPSVNVSINAGIYLLSNSIWDILPEGHYHLPELITGVMAAGGRVVSYHFDDYWIDIGAMPDYLQANADIAEAEGMVGKT
jgi:NDP-sugar pyrophosphorylase family protein